MSGLPVFVSGLCMPVQANLTFTFLLTLKMTPAKAVEMSVTSTNSLSQDYTNLDDQLPQTCHTSDVTLKLFLFSRISNMLRIFLHSHEKLW